MCLALKESSTRKYNVPSFWPNFIAPQSKCYLRLSAFPDTSSSFAFYEDDVCKDHQRENIVWTINIEMLVISFRKKKHLHHPLLDCSMILPFTLHKGNWVHGKYIWSCLWCSLSMGEFQRHVGSSPLPSLFSVSVLIDLPWILSTAIGTYVCRYVRLASRYPGQLKSASSSHWSKAHYSIHY